MGEKLEDSVEGGSDLKTVRYVDSPEKEENERRVSLVDTPERESVAIPDGSPVRNVMIVETSQEGTSDEDQWKPDREVVFKSSEGEGEDQGLQTGNRESSSESTNCTNTSKMDLFNTALGSQYLNVESSQAEFPKPITSSSSQT